MTISIAPNAFGLALLPWVTLFALASVALGVALFVRAAPRTGMGRRWAYGLALRVVFWGFIGARALHVIDHAGFYADAPFDALYIWGGGMSLWGALLGGLAGLVWHTRPWPALWRALADRATGPLFAAMALGRVGDLLAGERPGTPTSLPWGIEYTNPASQAHLSGGGAVHPVAGYEMALDLAVLALVWSALGGAGRRLPGGARFFAALGAYAVGRAIIGLARVDPTWLGLQQAQWMGLAAVAAGAWWLWRRWALARGPRDHG